MVGSCDHQNNCAKFATCQVVYTGLADLPSRLSHFRGSRHKDAFAALDARAAMAPNASLGFSPFPASVKGRTEYFKIPVDT